MCEMSKNETLKAQVPVIREAAKENLGLELSIFSF